MKNHYYFGELSTLTFPQQFAIHFKPTHEPLLQAERFVGK